MKITLKITPLEWELIPWYKKSKRVKTIAPGELHYTVKTPTELKFLCFHLIIEKP